MISVSADKGIPFFPYFGFSLVNLLLSLAIFAPITDKDEQVRC